jgi:hypothetical protein
LKKFLEEGSLDVLAVLVLTAGPAGQSGARIARDLKEYGWSESANLSKQNIRKVDANKEWAQAHHDNRGEFSTVVFVI